MCVSLYRGACSGSLSSCGLAGFALESRCHTGQTILFDVVNELHWAVDIRTHSIAQVIEHLLKPDWDQKAKSISSNSNSKVERASSGSFWPSRWGWGHPKEPEEPQPPPARDDRSKTNVPQPKVEDDCIDCIKWGAWYLL